MAKSRNNMKTQTKKEIECQGCINRIKDLGKDILDRLKTIEKTNKKEPKKALKEQNAA